MKDNPVLQTLLRIGAVYASALRRFLLVSLLAVFSIALGAGIVFPLWYLADRSPELYTTVLFVLIGGAACFLFGKKLIATMRRHGSLGTFLRAGLMPAVRRTLLTLATLAVLYGILVLYANGLLLIAVPATIAALLAFGYCLSVRRHTARSGLEER